MDNVIEAAFPQDASRPPAMENRKLALRMMALRHEYLDDNVYGAMREAANDTLPKVFLCTIGFLQLCQGGRSPRKLKQLEHSVLLVDDYHHLSFEGLLAALANFEAVIVAGDKEQCPANDTDRDVARVASRAAAGSSAGRAAGDLEDNQGGGWRAPAVPLRRAVSWLDCTAGRRFQLNTSYCFGPTIVELLGNMAPNVWPGMNCAGPTDTQVFPFVFPYLADGRLTATPLS